MTAAAFRRISRAARRFPALLPILSAILCLAAATAQGAELHLVQEREIYVALDKLNAMGMLPGFLANTRPYDMQAVREAARTASPGPESAEGLVRWVRHHAEPAATIQGEVSLARSTERRVEWNEGGIPAPEGFSAGFSALGRYEPYSWLSFDGAAAAWLGEGGDRGSRAGEYSVQAGHKYVSLQGGRITTWYGPGRRGALVFTNNAQAVPGVRLHNPVPIPVPGFLSFLGSVQYDLFFARLDADRPLPETTLSGFRIALRPGRYLELGASRAIHFGGKGEGEGLSDWWRAFANTDEDVLSSKTNQIAGFDAQLTLPFKVHPVQLYFEWAAEDQARGGYDIPRMAKWAVLGGVFFPAVLGNPDFDIRFEYADNHMGGHGDLWYVHAYSPHSYKGRVLGHAMGTDARDISLQGRWFLYPSMYLELTLNRTERFSPGPEEERTNGARLAFVGWITPSVRAGAGILAERVSNAGGSGGSGREAASWIELAWRFSGPRSVLPERLH